MTHRPASLTAGLALIVAATVVTLDAQTRPASSSPEERARAVLARAPVIDGHNDLPWEMRQRVWYDFTRIDVSKPQPGLMTDIPRLRSGGVGGQFWSVYVPATLQGDAAVSATLEQIDAVHEMVRRYPSAFTLVRTADELLAAQKAGKIASLLGVEGGHSIAGSLGTLRMFRQLGASYLTLAYGTELSWAGAPTVNRGLTPFGKAVVRELNRLGMLVDLSHTSTETMRDALDTTTAPVIFSHSSARGVCDVPRNVPDEILKRLPSNGGVVMVTFVPGFISCEVASYNRLPASQRTGTAPRATLAQVADHIDHIRKVAGIDHIGLGGDFDGIESVVQGLEDVSTYPALLAELFRRGYSEADVAKITSGNVLRAMRGAEAAARALANQPPAIDRIETLDQKR